MNPGTLIDDRFEIIEVLGQGAFGTVYKAKQINFDRVVALKLLNSAVVDKDTSSRLLREAKALSSMQHRNLTSFYGYGVWNYSAYIAMEYIAGTSLQDLLKAGKPIAAKKVVNVFQQICDGLASAHLHGIIHRDLKPSNVILSNQKDGSELIKVIDFGLARALPESGLNQQQLTDLGQAVGTVHYMSPEQCLGNAVDHRSDIYAAGCMFFQCLTGRLLFEADAAVAIMFMHLRDAPDEIKATAPCDVGIERNLQEILHKCLKKNPDDRYESINDFKADLERIGTELQKHDTLTFEAEQRSQTQPDADKATAAAEVRSGTRSKKLRWAVGAAACAAACMVIGLLFSPSIMVSLANSTLQAAPKSGLSTASTSPLFQWCLNSAARSDNPEGDRLLTVLYKSSEREPMRMDNYAAKVQTASTYIDRLKSREQRAESVAITFNTYRELLILANRVAREAGTKDQSDLFDTIYAFAKKHDKDFAAKSTFDIAAILTASGNPTQASKWYQEALLQSGLGSEQIPTQLSAHAQLSSNFALQNDLKTCSEHELQMLQLLAKHLKNTGQVSDDLADDIDVALHRFANKVSKLPRPLAAEQHQQLQAVAAQLTKAADAASKPKTFQLRLNALLVMMLREDGQLQECVNRLRKMEQLMDAGGLWTSRSMRDRLANEQFWTCIYADRAKQDDMQDFVFANQLQNPSEIARYAALITLSRIEATRHQQSRVQEILAQALTLTASQPEKFEGEDLASLHQMLGQYLLDKGDFNAAITSLSKSVALCDTGQTALLAHIGLGECYAKLHLYDKADSQFLASVQYLNKPGLTYPKSYFDRYRDNLVALGKGDMRVHVNNWERMAVSQDRLQD